jgi:hypothetical protein
MKHLLELPYRYYLLVLRLSEGKVVLINSESYKVCLLEIIDRIQYKGSVIHPSIEWVTCIGDYELSYLLQGDNTR